MFLVLCVFVSYLFKNLSQFWIFHHHVFVKKFYFELSHVADWYNKDIWRGKIHNHLIVRCIKLSDGDWLKWWSQYDSCTIMTIDSKESVQFSHFALFSSLFTSLAAGNYSPHFAVCLQQCQYRIGVNTETLVSKFKSKIPIYNKPQLLRT